MLNVGSCKMIPKIPMTIHVRLISQMVLMTRSVFFYAAISLEE